MICQECGKRKQTVGGLCPPCLDARIKYLQTQPTMAEKVNTDRVLQRAVDEAINARVAHEPTPRDLRTLERTADYNPPPPNVVGFKRGDAEGPPEPIDEKIEWKPDVKPSVWERTPLGLDGGPGPLTAQEAEMAHVEAWDLAKAAGESRKAIGDDPRMSVAEYAADTAARVILARNAERNAKIATADGEVGFWCVIAFYIFVGVLCSVGTVIVIAHLLYGGTA